ncbi:TonB-dependent receptor [Phenylobacterium sp.]|uniref:TonB-dependent receptor n=1 Tax=Phenylobacterium sp. TaxID=1871053 RepID=UPI002F4258B9
MLAALCLPAAARADDAPATSTVGEVIVTATRAERNLADVPVSASIVTSEEIGQTPANSLDDVLRRVPSLDVPIAASYQTHPTSLNVSMRGLGGIRALVLLDGVPLNDPFQGYVQWNRVPLETIDRVEVVRGGGATLWGNYAMGGVVNILTRAPDRNELILQGGGGSYGTYRGDAYGGLVANDAIKLGLEGGTFHTDGFQTAPEDLRGPINAPTSFTADNIALTGQFSPAETLTAHLRIDHHENHQVLNSRLAINKQKNWSYSGDATQRLGVLGEVTLTLFHTENRFRTDNTDTPTGAEMGEAEFVQNRHITSAREDGASVVWAKTFDSGWLRSATVGGDYHGIRGIDTGDIFVDSGEQVRSDVGSGQQRFLGAFGEVSLKPIDVLEVLASVRYQEFRNFDAFDGSPGGIGIAPDKTTSSVDPRVSVRWSVTPEFALRAAAYKAFRAPNLGDLYRAFATSAGIFFGNPDLRPETLEGEEAGFDLNHGGLRLQVTAFSSTIRDLITSAPLDDSQLPPGFFFGTRNINAGRARSLGVEAEADWVISPRWSTTLGYTYADSTIRESEFDPASIGKQQGGIPRNRLNAGVTYNAAAGWRVTPQVRWLSKSWGDNDNTLPVDEHVVVDLAAAYPVTPKLEAFVQVENLFDRRYTADNNGFELPRLGTPFSALAGLRWVID